MGKIVLPKQIIPGYRVGELPYTPDVELDKSNAFGARTFWAFIPSMHGPVISTPTATTSRKSYKSLGQPLMASLTEDATSAVNNKVFPLSYNSWGYKCLAARFFDQSSGGGWEYTFGTGTAGQIRFPNKQSWTIWALFKPQGNGSPNDTEDPRILSRDTSSAEADHYYMIGGVRNLPACRARSRIKINGTTYTTVVTGQNWQSDAINFIACSYDGSAITVSHLREDGGFASAQTTGLSGDLTDNTVSAGTVIGGNYVVDNAFQGEIIGVGALDYAESNRYRLQSLARNIGQIIKPKNDPVYFFTAATGSISVGQSTETDSAQTVTPQRAYSVAQATETDSAQVITPARAITVNQASETDSAQALTHAKQVQVSQAAETDTAQTVTAARTYDVNQATETDSAQALTVAKQVAINQTTETDSAQALTIAKGVDVGQASETDSAQAVSASAATTVGQASETDTAQAVTPARTYAVAQTTETDTAQSIAPAKQVTISIATETDAGQTITAQRAVTVSIASETDSAQAITATTSGFTVVNQSTETDAAQPITAAKLLALGQATQSDTALTIAPQKALEIGIVTETDSALSISHAKQVQLSLVSETDLALAITQGGLPNYATLDRLIRVQWEARIVQIPSEDRIIQVEE